MFRLDDDHHPAEVAGVPPNPGDDGQRWGNPVYDWDALRANDYGWWVDRLERLFDLVDVPASTTSKASTSSGPSADSDDPATASGATRPATTSSRRSSALGDLPFIVEDLGFLDASLVDLRDRFAFPGMRVPQYADWCREGDMYQPMHYPETAVAYTSTHDTDTFVGYYRDLADRTGTVSTTTRRGRRGNQLGLHRGGLELERNRAMPLAGPARPR